MDYEKLHKETLAALQQMVLEGKITEEIARGICADFVKESEDERIRKNLIEYFSNCKALKYSEQEVVAWLEKQNKPQVRTGIEWVNTIDDACEHRYAEEYAHGEYCHEQSFRWGFQEGVDWLEKQGEQKPADKVEPKFMVKYAGNKYNVLEIKDIAGVTFYGIEDEPNHIDYVLPENCDIVGDYGYGVKEKGSPYPTKSAIFSKQNPAWSKEDEKMLDAIIGDIQFTQKVHTREVNQVVYERKIDWLKSLKERMKGE